MPLAELIGIVLAALGMAAYALRALVAAYQDRNNDMRDERDYWKRKYETLDSEVYETAKQMNASLKLIADVVESTQRELRRRND